MITTMKYIPLQLLAIITAILLTGCETPTATFQEVKSTLAPQPGKALVFIYYKHLQGTFNSEPNCRIYANQQLVCKRLETRLFCSYQADPGQLHLSTRATFTAGLPVGVPKDLLVIQVDQNKIYYVQLSVRLFDDQPLKLVSNEVGEDEMKDFQWLNPLSSR